jgi:predicted DNA-binding transcriptional regulator AlpA
MITHAADEVPSEYLSTLAVSKMTGFSKATLDSWRSRGTGGPRWFKIGGKTVAYKREDVRAFMEQDPRVPSSVQLAEANA